MRFPSKEIVERVRRQFPPGTRVELAHMIDCQAPPIDTQGTVIADAAASLIMSWDNGSGLNVIYGEDKVIKLQLIVHKS